MPDSPEARQQALDHLVTQVNQDNVLAAHRTIKTQADDLKNYLNSVMLGMSMCGGDPVSADSVGGASFQNKVEQLLSVHWTHQEELDEAADRLARTAREYGYTEQDIAASFNKGAESR